MEFENRNPRTESSSNLPLLVLLILVGVIAALLYIGWKYQRGSNDEKLTNVSPDSMATAISKGEVLEEATTDQTPKKQGEDLPSVPKVHVSKDGKTVLVEGKIADYTKDDKNIDAEEPPKKIKEEIKKLKVSATAGESITHTIQTGETFYGVANRYNLKFSTLQNLNPDVKPEGVKSGVTKLKVKVQAKHTVGAGDILRVVAKKYGITVEQLMTANKKAKNVSERGEQLIIPFAEKK